MTTRLFLVIDIPEFATPEELRDYAVTFLGLDRPADAIDMLTAVFDGEVTYVPVAEAATEAPR